MGDKTSIGFQVHVHMLRHACGYALANAGHDTRSIQDYLGHKAIQHTVRYTELSRVKFKDFWATDRLGRPLRCRRPRLVRLAD